MRLGATSERCRRQALGALLRPTPAVLARASAHAPASPPVTAGQVAAQRRNCGKRVSVLHNPLLAVRTSLAPRRPHAASRTARGPSQETCLYGHAAEQALGPCLNLAPRDSGRDSRSVGNGDYVAVAQPIRQRLAPRRESQSSESRIKPARIKAGTNQAAREWACDRWRGLRRHLRGGVGRRRGKIKSNDFR